VHFRLQKLAQHLRTDPVSADRPNAAAELILRKLQQLSVVVEATVICEEMRRPVGVPPRALT
jgi:hypothetical protein